jgi:hypothetical protein
MIIFHCSPYETCQLPTNGFFSLMILGLQLLRDDDNKFGQRQSAAQHCELPKRLRRGFTVLAQRDINVLFFKDRRLP